ncbi:nitroreductase [Moelleriella libera RCEF 2490]|uniref:Nitroreductase n=1 Tax=Moelleriella libera RCEF 2490 TaxID=1081109 RepID=A0A168DAU6_9HYPO|nr:nitroreductase [Moelleriella libera RCEF 2490]
MATEEVDSAAAVAAGDAGSIDNSHSGMLFDEAVISRHSTRLFLPKPVPDTALQSALELATHSPSNSNTQAWRLYVVTGAALDRLKTALKTAATSDAAPNIPPLPEEFRPWRSDLGKAIYGEGWGIPRDDAEARKKAVLLNFDFFGAPVGMIVCMSKKLPGFAAMSVGMYLQTLLLALTDRGLGSCVQVSIAGYRDVVRQEVGVAEDLEILCGVSVGYEDEAANVNKVRVKRLGFDETTVFVKD